MVRITIPNTEPEITYFLDDRLKKNLDRQIENLDKKDKDFLMVVDGREGSGKSTLSLQIGKYVDNTLDLSRVCFTPEEFRQAIFSATKGQCVIYDEAFTGLSSRSAVSKINKMLVSLMMQMRQKNLFVIIVLPTFFQLDKYVAMFRAKSLLHVYENKGRRGYFLGFNHNKKKALYLKGTKEYTYRYVRTDFKGRFYGVFALGGKDDKYRDKKGEALEKTESEPEQESKYRTQRKSLLVNWYLEKKEKEKMSQEAFCEYIKPFGIDLDRKSISLMLVNARKTGEIARC